MSLQRWCQCDILTATMKKKAARWLAAIALVCRVYAQGQVPAANPDIYYHLGPDSLPQDGVPKGEIRGPFTLPSNVYPGTQHTYWVYVPAPYNPALPASLMIFND